MKCSEHAVSAVSKWKYKQTYTLHCNSHHLCLPRSRLNSRHVLFVKHRVWTEFCLYGKYIVIIIVKTNLIMLLLTDVKALRFIFCQFSNFTSTRNPSSDFVCIDGTLKTAEVVRVFHIFPFSFL